MIRRFLFWILLIAFLWIIITRQTEIRVLGETLSQGQWTWILAAFAIQLLYYSIVAGAYQASFRTVGVDSQWIHLIPVTFASIFMGVVAPVLGASNAVLFIDDASRRGQSATRATVGTLLYLISNLVGFTIVLVLGMIYLFIQDTLHAYQVIGALILMIILATLASILLIGLWRPAILSRILKWVQRMGNGLLARLKQPPLFKESWADDSTGEFSRAASAIALYPHRLGFTVFLALLSHLVNIACLFTLFQAFNQPVRLGVLFASYSIGILFWIISIVPQGIGVVEGVMTLVITSLGVPTEKAAIITLAFRGLSFWLPFVLGFFMLRRMQVFRTAKER